MSFDAAFSATMKHEGYGVRTNDPVDPGGDTYSGISRQNWPSWEGWALLNQIANGRKDLIPALAIAVEVFYRVNFWDRLQGDKILSMSAPVAHELFDTSVNCGVSKGVSILQEALNLLNNNKRIYPDLIVDGDLGARTMETLRIYLASRPPTKEAAERRLLKVMNCLQGAHYVKLMRAHPEREKYRGWFDRI